MELILLKDVEEVGRKGDVIRVRDGFGRNFLIPRKFAMPATRANRAFIEEQKKRTAVKRTKEKSEAQTSAQKLGKTKCTIEAQAGEQDKLFGSVTAEQIAEALNHQGYQLKKKQIHLQEPIRLLGSHSVIVEIYPEVKAAVTVEVIRKS